MSKYLKPRVNLTVRALQMPAACNLHGTDCAAIADGHKRVARMSRHGYAVCLESGPDLQIDPLALRQPDTQGNRTWLHAPYVMATSNWKAAPSLEN